MTAPAGLLARLHDLGVTPQADGDVLRLRPASIVPAGLLAELRQHKPALLALLVERNDNLAPAAAPAPGQSLPPASRSQAAAEAADHAAIAAEPPGPPATVPVPPDLLAQWETELAALLAATPGQRITDPERAAAYFAAEARRRLGMVRHDRHAAGLLMGFWRHARGRAAP